MAVRSSKYQYLPVEICSRSKKRYGEKALSNVSVYKWSSAFKKGRETVENEPHELRPRTSITGEKRACRCTHSGEQANICLEYWTSVKLVWKQSSNNTFSTRKCAPDGSRVYWRMNTSLHGCKWRNHCCRGTSRKGTFLDSLVTTDETWVHYFTPESKHSSMQWHHPESPKPKKAKITFSAGKVMATIFWESKGVLYVDFLTERCTINAKYYSALLEGPVKAAIRNKRKSAQTSVSFLQDNARPHVAARTVDTIQKMKWNFLPHIVRTLLPQTIASLAPKGASGQKKVLQ